MANDTAPRGLLTEGEDRTFDFEHARELAWFVLRAPKRHPRAAILAFLATAATTALVAMATPKSYAIDARLLAQRNLVMPSLGNPRRAIPSDADAPTRGAVEAIRKHDSLVGLVKATALVDRFRVGRPAILLAKDRAIALVVKPTEEEKLRALVGYLEKKLVVQADESTIKISLDWHDPVVGQQIVAMAEQRFLEERKAGELAVIRDTIAILEAQTKEGRDEIAKALAEAIRVKASLDGAADAPPTPTQAGTVTTTKAASAPIVIPLSPKTTPKAASDVAAKLEATRKAIHELDDPRQRKIADLKAQLADLRLTYADAHPAIVAQEQKIKEASVEPPELVKLKQEERALLGQLDSLPPEYSEAPKAVAQPGPIVVPLAPKANAPVSTPNASGEPREDPPQLATAKAALTLATRKYEDVLDRLDAARIELHTADAAFKYRYVEVQPAEVPQKQRRNKLPIEIAGGLFLAVALSFFVATALDLGSGRFIEPWQVRRRLRVPLLSEVDTP